MSQINVNTIKDKSGLGAPNFPNGVNATGVVTATSFSGDGGNLTGIAQSQLVINGLTKVQATTSGTVITGIATANNFKTGSTNVHDVGVEAAGINVLGADTPIGTGATIYNNGNITVLGTITAPNFSGEIQTAAQPNITSLGTLSSLNVSGGVSIGGTLTYEDVTNVDSVGLITARDGIKVTSGDIEVGSGLKHSHSASTTTYTVKVITKTAAHRYNGTGSSLGYTVDGIESPFLTLTPGRTYKFDQADSSNNTHQIKFYRDAAKSYQSLYEEGVTYNGTAGQAGAYTQIVISDTTPQVLHYQCVNHGHMGNSFYTNTSVVNQVGVSTFYGMTYQSNGDLRFGASNSIVFSNAAKDNLSYLTHGGTEHLWNNASGDVKIRNLADDKNVIIETDNGSGGSTNYFVADGSTGETILYNYGNEKIKTTGGGVNITGVCTATDFSGAGAAAADFPNGINVANTKKITFPGNGNPGAYIKHQSGHFEIKNETGNYYWDNIGSVRLRTGASYTTALEISTAQNATFAGSVSDSKGNLRSVPQTQYVSNVNVISAHAGRHLLSTNGGWTINTSTGFAIGEMVTLVNHSGSAQTLFEATGVTIYDTADGATGDHSVSARGMATLLCVASNEYYVTGNIA